MKLNVKYALTCLMMTLCFVSKGQDKLNFQDSRANVTTPDSYLRSFEPHFKEGSAINLSQLGSNRYYAVLGIRGWQDDTGGKAHELAFSNDGNIFLRSGYSAGWAPWRTLLISNENGFYGIGTDNPKEKLSVNGNIRAREIKVEVNNWPDYVFRKDYKLPDLQETARFIREKGHLNGIPSAEDVQVNGLELGDMNARLLKKIEELTLHLIEKDNEIKSIKSDYEKLKENVDFLIKQHKNK